MGTFKTNKLIKKTAAFLASILLLQNACLFTKTLAAMPEPNTEILSATTNMQMFPEEDAERFRSKRISDFALSKATDSISNSLVHNSRFSTDEYVYMYGMDVSNHQYDIDWNAVAASGVKFVIIRVGFRGYGTVGAVEMDARFERNIRGAIDAGLDVGVYFYTQAISEKEAIEEANCVLSYLNGAELTLPVYYDIESVDYDTGRMDSAGLTREQFTANCDAFCRTIEENGYQAGVYANKYWLINKLDAAYLEERYAIWLANYTTETTYEGEYQIWQYTDSGSVSGVETGVDRNVMYSRKLDYEKEYILLTEENVAVTPKMTGDFHFGSITYTSSDPSIAAVGTDGSILPISNGTATITAVSTNGTSDTIEVEVKLSAAVSLNRSFIYFSEVGTEQGLEVLSDMEEDITVVWESSNPDVVVVDENGVVHSVGSGVANITATIIGVTTEVCSVSVVVSTTEVGDCNADGVLNAADATEILIFAARLGIHPELREDTTLIQVFDYNGDGEVDAVDASDLLIYCAKVGAGTIKE